MCGLFGYVTVLASGSGSGSGSARPLGTAARDGRPDLTVAVRALRHRGPDDEGTFEDVWEGGAAGLAHTRLAIIDLSPAGHQPMASADGRLVLAFNGEIYNHRDLRRELEGRGVAFRSTCDSEVLLAAYEVWGGRGCLERLRGMFAFAIWDRRERTLFLARDRLGVKPLYYALTPRGIAFASEVRALLAVGACERRMSRSGLASFLTYGSVYDPDTMVDGVRSLEPATSLRLSASASGITSHAERYWTVPLDRAAPADVPALREVLSDAVRLRLEADVPVGIFLSSGIDSAAVAALASRASPRPIHTFTVTFDEAAWDEGAHAADVARRFGCEHHEALLRTQEIGGEVDAAVAALDLPSADGINTYFVSRAARRAGLAVALSGIGGDELFAGYSTFRRFARALALKQRLPVSPALRRHVERIAAWSQVGGATRKLAALAAADARASSIYAVLRGMFTEGQIAALAGIEPGEPGRDEAAAIDRGLEDGTLDVVNAYGALELTRYLRSTLLRDTDAMSMAHALEVREPLLDHVLVEHAMRIRGADKLPEGGGRGNKPVLTAAVPEVPEGARVRAKMGFTLPFDRWLRGKGETGGLASWAEARLTDPSVARAGLCPAEVQSMWRAFSRGGSGVSWSRVWCLAVLVDWCARHEVSA